MTPLATLVWLLNALADTIGQLAFKAAAVHGSEEQGIKRWIAMAKNKWIWIGVFSYVFEILLWLAFLSLVPLSVGVLLGSFNILVVMIGGRIFFNEKITKRRVAAISLIAAGVCFVGWSGG